MTFQQFIDAVKSAWGAINNITIAASLLAALGINSVFPSVPGPATVLACLLLYLLGFLVSCYKSAAELATKDAKIAELEKRSERITEEQKVKSILASLDPDKLGLVGMVLTRGSVDEHTEKGNRAFLVESGILARVESSTIEAFVSYTLTSVASSVIAGDEALRESAVKRGWELAGRIEERSKKSRTELNAQRPLAETAARVSELEKRLEEAEEKLAVYEDGDRRLQEKVKGMPRIFMLALGYAVEMGDVFEVMGNSDFERELEEIESQYGFVKCRKVWGNCKEWVATEQGRRAWSLAGGDDLYDPSSEELTRIRMCVLRTRECAIASLRTLETQVLMYLYDMPGAKCMHATAEKVTDSLGSWAVETKVIDDECEIEPCDLTEDARGIVEALAMDKAEKRLYKRTFGWKEEMVLDKLAENLDPGWKRLGDF